MPKMQAISPLMKTLFNFAIWNSTITSPVTLTAGAIKEIKRLMAADGFDPAHSLRLGVKGGGCSGMTYILGLIKKRRMTRSLR